MWEAINRTAGSFGRMTSNLLCCQQQYVVLHRYMSGDRQWIHIWHVQEQKGGDGINGTAVVEYLRTIPLDPNRLTSSNLIRCNYVM